MKTDAPKNIEDDDLLGRAIFSSREAKRATVGKIRSSVFTEKLNKSLSVDRFNFCSDKELTNIQDKNAQVRSTKEKTQRSFYGWASLKVFDARKENRKVQSTPIKENPYHADIILPEDIETEDDQREHAINLAESSKWKPKYYSSH